MSRSTTLTNRLLKEFTSWQWEILLDLLDGEAVVVYIDGEAYAASRDGESFLLRNLREGKQYTVIGGQCTCPDSRYRRHVCKHADAVKRLSSLARDK